MDDWSWLGWIPLGVVAVVFGWIHFLLWKEARHRDAEWTEEEKRQQRVKDLYPDPPSYEDRMGVKYGPEQNE